MKKKIKKFAIIYLCKKIITIIMILAIAMIFKPKASEKITQNSVVGNLMKSRAYKRYSNFFNNVDDSFIIPGLETRMCPQGMCDAGDYILISAYDILQKNNSCLYIIDKDTGKYLKTIQIANNTSHVGGITYDGSKYIYIANSFQSSISRIELNTIINTINNGYIYCDMIKIKSDKGRKVRASFCSYDIKRDIIWVGVFNPGIGSYAYAYDINKNKAELKNVIDIPSFSQGMSFDDEYMYFSTSCCVYQKSKIYKCKYTEGKLITKSIFVTPPGSENIFINNDKMYILFESAAHQYYKGCILPSFCPVDRVCIYNL